MEMRCQYNDIKLEFLEKLVVEQLIEGPKGSKLKATLPGTTKLINSLCLLETSRPCPCQNLKKRKAYYQ